MQHLQLPLEPWRARARPVGWVAERVVLARAHVLAVPAEGVDGARAVAVEARVAGLADAGAGPGVTPRNGRKLATCWRKNIKLWGFPGCFWESPKAQRPLQA